MLALEGEGDADFRVPGWTGGQAGQSPRERPGSSRRLQGWGWMQDAGCRTREGGRSCWATGWTTPEDPPRPRPRRPRPQRRASTHWSCSTPATPLVTTPTGPASHRRTSVHWSHSSAVPPPCAMPLTGPAPKQKSLGSLVHFPASPAPRGPRPSCPPPIEWPPPIGPTPSQSRPAQATPQQATPLANGLGPLVPLPANPAPRGPRPLLNGLGPLVRLPASPAPRRPRPHTDHAPKQKRLDSIHWYGSPPAPPHVGPRLPQAPPLPERPRLIGPAPRRPRPSPSKPRPYRMARIHWSRSSALPAEMR